jgi:hypothetical protein
MRTKTKDKTGAGPEITSNFVHTIVNNKRMFETRYSNTITSERALKLSIEKLLDDYDISFGSRFDIFHYLRAIRKLEMDKKMTKHTASSIRKLLPPDSQKRIRYRGEWECILYDDQDITQSYALGFYARELKRCGLFFEFDPRRLGVLDNLSGFEDAAFTNQELFSPHWKYWCHVKRCKDYENLVDEQQFVDQVKYWNKPKKHYWDGSEHEFKRQFLIALAEHLHTVSHHFDTELDVDSWLLDRSNWAGSGSAYTGHKNDFSILGEKVKKTKWAWAWATTDHDIREEFYSNRPAMHKAIPKREPTKVRAVIAADMKTYLRMKYLNDKYVKHWYHNWELSPVTMSTTQQTDMWLNLSNFTGIRMPLDQSEFDQQQTKWCIISILKAYRARAPDSIWSVLINSIENGIIVVGKERLRYENGVMSGWYWTALIDTVINDITKRMAVNYLHSHGYFVKINKFYCQGDDDVFEFESYADAVAMWSAYIIFGFKVNPHKFYISRKRDEFLRKVIEQQSISGYPARSVISILWANPVGDEVEENETLLSARLTQWWQFSLRLNVPISRLDVIRDLIGVSKLSRCDVHRWLAMYRALGGAGMANQFSLIPSSEYEMTFSVEREKEVSWTPAMQEQQQALGYRLSRQAISSTMLITDYKPVYSVSIDPTVYKTKPTNDKQIKVNAVGRKINRDYPQPLNHTTYRWVDKDDRPVINDKYSDLYSRLTRKARTAFDDFSNLNFEINSRHSLNWLSIWASQRIQRFVSYLSHFHRVDIHCWKSALLKYSLHSPPSYFPAFTE